MTVSERDTVTLEVVVSGSSPYELEWFKNAVDIIESERISLTKHEGGRFTLVIRECEDDDTGEYCCVAQNEAGRVTCAGWLTIEGTAYFLYNLRGTPLLGIHLIKADFMPSDAKYLKDYVCDRLS